MKLNLGCGADKRDGWTNTDREVDLNTFPYPWKDNSAEVIELCAVLEHLLFPTKVIVECWRILKPNGKLIIRVPWFKSIAAVADIDHMHFFYDYSMDKFLEDNKLNQETKARFRIIKKTYMKNWSKVFKPIPLFLRNWIFNLCLEIRWDMEAVK